jgi:hypothetical protein
VPDSATIPRTAFLKFQGEYFLFLLPLFFILHRYAEHQAEIRVHLAAVLLIKYVVALGLISILLSFAFRSFRKSAIFTMIGTCVQLFFGSAHDWLKEMMAGTIWVKYSFILSALLVILILLFVYIKRTQRPFQKLTKYINTLLLVLIIVDLFKLELIRLTSKPELRIVADAQPALPSRDTFIREDIHLIIADGYAGNSEMLEVLQFNNTDFLNGLRARGFHVVDNTKSNYNYSAASMASLYSMNYLPNLQGKPDAEIFKISSDLLKKNYFADFLKNRGYEIKNFSIFDFAELPPFEDGFYARGTELITDHTLFARLNRDIGFHTAFTLKINSELKRLEKLLREEAGRDDRKIDSVITAIARKSNKPRFFYTHLLMPHGPYYYDSKGRFIGLEFHIDQRKHLEEKKNYLEYVQYCNRKLLSFIDRICKASARPPIVLLMSDHGLRHHTVPEPYHFSNINAVLFPDREYKGFYKGMSNVNQLRVLLNQRFRQKLPLLKDSSIFLGWEEL